MFFTSRGVFLFGLVCMTLVCSGTAEANSPNHDTPHRVVISALDTLRDVSPCDNSSKVEPTTESDPCVIGLENVHFKGHASFGCSFERYTLLEDAQPLLETSSFWGCSIDEIPRMMSTSSIALVATGGVTKTFSKVTSSVTKTFSNATGGVTMTPCANATGGVTQMASNTATGGVTKTLSNATGGVTMSPCANATGGVTQMASNTATGGVTKTLSNATGGVTMTPCASNATGGVTC